ncbi:hypothetical protein TREES_T100015566 [Tupaia chinensis]|uniref:Uncharacterized protein n=1 Tax=Tupaia chinensis TaxID=246437 RepID=L9LB26_TUPCH|nr:hypothetical protein TREES_T100015566 [Tupaia chinensis]
MNDVTDIQVPRELHLVLVVISSVHRKSTRAKLGLESTHALMASSCLGHMYRRRSSQGERANQLHSKFLGKYVNWDKVTVALQWLSAVRAGAFLMWRQHTTLGAAVCSLKTAMSCQPTVRNALVSIRTLYSYRVRHALVSTRTLYPYRVRHALVSTRTLYPYCVRHALVSTRTLYSYCTQCTGEYTDAVSLLCAPCTGEYTDTVSLLCTMHWQDLASFGEIGILLENREEASCVTQGTTTQISTGKPSTIILQKQQEGDKSKLTSPYS